MIMAENYITIVKEIVSYQGLNFKDFEDEMVDHICSAYEESEEETDITEFTYDFINSFHLTYAEPTGLFKLLYNYYFTGLKAVEFERFISTRKKVLGIYIKLLKNELTSWHLLLWGLVAYFCKLLIGPFLELLSALSLSDFLIGCLMGFSPFMILIIFSKIPIYDANPNGLGLIFGKWHSFIKPKSTKNHWLLRVALLPFWIFIMLVLINRTYLLPETLNAVLLFSLFITSYTTVRVLSTEKESY